MGIVLLLLIGTAASIIGALIGIGGGGVIVAARVFFSYNTEIIRDRSVENAIGTSSLTLVFTGLFSMLAYGRSKTVDLKSGMLFSIGIVPGSLAGAYLSRFLNQDSFGIIFGAFLLLIFMVLTFKTRMI